MKFVITRTSDCLQERNEPPCDGAKFAEKIIKTSSTGKESIVCVYTIEVDSLSDLWCLISKIPKGIVKNKGNYEGELVIGLKDRHLGLPYIEIYDSWRE